MTKAQKFLFDFVALCTFETLYENKIRTIVNRIGSHQESLINLTERCFFNPIARSAVDFSA